MLLIVVGLLVVLFVLIVAGYFVWQSNRKDDIELNSDESTVVQVWQLNDEQLKAVAARAVDETKDFSGAYAKAQSLVMIGKYDEGLELYAKLSRQPQANHEFYSEYAMAYARAKKYDQAIATMETAVKKLQDDTSVTDDVEKAQTKVYKSKIDGFKDAAQS